jgi:hypothetical protein
VAVVALSGAPASATGRTLALPPTAVTVVAEARIASTPGPSTEPGSGGGDNGADIPWDTVVTAAIVLALGVGATWLLIRRRPPQRLDE